MNTQKQAQSLLDFLQHLPEFQSTVEAYQSRKNGSDSLLYQIWKENEVQGDMVFNRPVTSSSDVYGLEKEGLLKASGGGKLQITDKGKQILKKMILNDPYFAFGKNKARTKTASTKTASTKPVYRNWCHKMIEQYD